MNYSSYSKLTFVHYRIPVIGHKLSKRDKLAAVLLISGTQQQLSRQPSSVQVADLNSDNAPEIIGLDNTSAAVVVLKNLGNGKYGAPTYYAVSGQPNGIAVGDFNGDGRLDVAVATGAYNATQGKVAVFIGNGDTTLQLLVYHNVSIPANSIAVADFNNDNRPDIAVIGNTNNNGTNKVSILTNTGSSFTEHAFTAPTYFTANGLGPDGDLSTTWWLETSTATGASISLISMNVRNAASRTRRSSSSPTQLPDG